MVVITGGEGGLGRALQAAFAATGAEVRAPGRAGLDVGDEAQVEAYFDRLDRLAVLVANAGITRDGLLASLSPVEFGATLDINLRGTFLCARAALRPMRRAGGGHLIFIGSRAGRIGPAGQSGYAAAKAGLIGLAQTLARESGPENIRCNVVLPGFLETPMTAKLSPARCATVRAEHALGRFNTPENAARFVVFLAGLDHVSGQVFTLDSRIDAWT